MTDHGYWLALLRAPRVGRSQIEALIREFGAAEAVFSATRKQLTQAGLGESAIEHIKAGDWSGIERDREWLSDPRHHFITEQDPAYPEQLRRIPDPPAALFVAGDPDCLRDPQLAMVGSRNPTQTGRRNAAEFSRHLSGCGLTITSGLATGIDAAAHEGALAAGGPTIAVCAHGLDRVYPARHRDLARQIADNGALVSEFPPGTEPKREHFPSRNRIISGLSLGTLVVEAARKSGSLITARLANEQGREVFAIPGSIHNPQSRGCHRLIRQGAKLVESARDILEELGALAEWLDGKDAESRPGPTEQPAPPEEPDGYSELIGHLDFDPTPIDTIVERSGLTPDVVSSMLLVLELQGRVEAHPGSRYSLVTQGHSR